MIKFILAFELMFFFVAGTQIVHYEVACARVAATTEVLLSIPVSALTQVSI